MSNYSSLVSDVILACNAGNFVEKTIDSTLVKVEGNVINDALKDIANNECTMISKGTILYFGNFEMPDKCAAAHRVLNNAKIFRDLGYKVVFCGIYKSNPYPHKIISFENIPRSYPRNTLEWIYDLSSFSHYKNCIERYDDVKAVVVYDFHALPLIRLKYYCKRKNVKIIGDVSEWYENRFSLNPTKFIKCLDTHLVMRWLYKKMDGMIVISDFLETYYKKCVKNVINIPPLVDTEEIIWNKKIFRTKKNASFVYNGTTKETKDKLDVIIDALSHFTDKEFTFNVYGLTKDDVVKIYPKIAKKIELLNKKVIFHGWVSHDDSIRALFENSCCLIIRNSTRKNNAGFPTKFVEATTSGIDIITTNISNVSRYSKNESVTIIADNSAEAVERELLKYILEYSGDRKREPLSRIFDYRNWESEFAKLLDCMEIK